MAERLSMFHRLTSTDEGVQCFRCGLTVDNPTMDDDLERIALNISCKFPTQTAHHMMDTGKNDDRGYPYSVECHYCGNEFTADTAPGDFDPECKAER